MAQIMFESFRSPALYIGIQAVLALYASGRKTGIVLDSGYGVTHTVPIYEGHAIQHGCVRLGIGGQNVSNYLIQSLEKRGHSFTTRNDREFVQSMKEKLCYVALDRKRETGSRTEKLYTLPDGNTLNISNELFQATEIMFMPSLLGIESTDGVDEMVCNSVMKCDLDIRKDLFSNVVLSGGNTMFPGMGVRLHKEIIGWITEKTSFTPNVNIVTQSGHSAWIGGSTLASLDMFKNMWISKREYEEYGPSIVHTKSF